jgi:hypothetical protein
MKKTLNGYDQDVAQQMIANFANNYTSDTSSKSTLAWYSADQLKNINDLLKAEMASVGTDGVRLYFGCDAPAPGTKKLNLSILMVSTQPRVPGNANQSNHADYYDHDAEYLNNGPFGATINDNAALALSQGAFLYHQLPPPADNGSNGDSHYIDNATAYNWVRNRCELNGGCDTSPLNTKSEWFDISFITGLFNSIIDNGQSGLRIYLGKGRVDKAGLVRDVTVLVPTEKNGDGADADNYNCPLEQIQSNFQNLGASKFSSKGLASQESQANTTNASLKTKPHWLAGGYDEGELCPNSCN